MRFADILGLALSALYQQKTRTALTALGVVIGSFVLLLSLSIGQGVREVIAEEWRRNDQLRRINVWPNYRPKEENIPSEDIEVKGAMSDERRERLRLALIRRWDGIPKKATIQPLTPEQLEKLAELEHVVAVVPDIDWFGRVHLNGQRRNITASAAEPNDSRYQQRIVAGSFFTAEQPRGALVSEYLLYKLGLSDEADMQRVVGQKMRLEFSSQPYRSRSLLWLLGGEAPQLTPAEEDVLGKIGGQLPRAVAHLDLTADEKKTLTQLLKRPRTRPRPSAPIRISEEFTIAGVVRVATDEEIRKRIGDLRDNVDVFLPATTAAEFYFRVPENRAAGVHRVTVRVDSEDNVKAVDRRINEMGLASYAPIEFLERVRFNYLMFSLTASFVALLALLVASLGIANTLLMSVLERTHEIGVMKAVGRGEMHLQMLFLMEGGLIGLMGSGLGLLSAWLLSYPLDNLARRIAEKQEQAHLTQTLFIFPWWLVLGVPAFVTLLTMLAAVYPARRAARVNPMTALRHE